MDILFSHDPPIKMFPVHTFLYHHHYCADYVTENGSCTIRMEMEVTSFPQKEEESASYRRSGHSRYKRLLFKLLF